MKNQMFYHCIGAFPSLRSESWTFPARQSLRPIAPSLIGSIYRICFINLSITFLPWYLHRSISIIMILIAVSHGWHIGGWQQSKFNSSAVQLTSTSYCTEDLGYRNHHHHHGHHQHYHNFISNIRISIILFSILIEGIWFMGRLLRRDDDKRMNDRSFQG